MLKIYKCVNYLINVTVMADCVDNFILSVFLLIRRKSRQGPIVSTVSGRLSKMLKMYSTSWGNYRLGRKKSC